jgi:hypothetical protein
MNAPTATHLQILKLLAAGGVIVLPTKEQILYRVLINCAPVRYVRARVLHEIATNGWVAFNGAKERYELTRSGQEMLDVKAYVRGFAGGA